MCVLLSAFRLTFEIVWKMTKKMECNRIKKKWLIWSRHHRVSPLAILNVQQQTNMVNLIQLWLCMITRQYFKFNDVTDTKAHQMHTTIFEWQCLILALFFPRMITCCFLVFWIKNWREPVSNIGIEQLMSLSHSELSLSAYVLRSCITWNSIWFVFIWKWIIFNGI